MRGDVDPAAPSPVSRPTERPGAREGPGTRRQQIVVAVIMAVVVLGVDAIWYLWLRPYRLLEPLFLVGITVVFFGVVRVVTGRRDLGLSRQGRWVVAGTVILLSAHLLTGRSWTFNRLFAASLAGLPWAPIHGFLYFALCSVVFRTALPYVLARRLAMTPASLGYRPPRSRGQLLIYLALVGIMIPLVLLASAQPAFLHKYPQAQGVVQHGVLSLELFVLYQLAYLVVFASGESFWRGFIVFGLDEDLGWLALTYMASVYSVAHFGKPLPEAWGALVAGYVLGAVALRYRNFWLGVAVHWSVALGMDIAVLVRRGLL